MTRQEMLQALTFAELLRREGAIQPGLSRLKMLAVTAHEVAAEAEQVFSEKDGKLVLLEGLAGEPTDPGFTPPSAA